MSYTSLSIPPTLRSTASTSNRTAAIRRGAPFVATSAVAAAYAMLATPAGAQEVPTGDKTMATIKVKDEGGAEPTTQIGKLPQSLRDIPQTLTIVNRQTLDAQSATKLTDALRNVPGITIAAGEGGQIGDNVNLRGFSARTDLFLDGFRDRGQYSRDTFFLNSVEVLKGPSSILFGRGSTGGVINQTSKKPFLRDAIEVAGSIGTENYYRATADVNQKLSDTAALRVVALGHKNESTRDVVQSERYGLSPSVRFGVGSDLEMTASMLIQRNRDIPDYGFPLVQYQGQLSKPIDAPANFFYGFTDDRFDQDVNNLNLTIQKRLSETATLTNLSQYTDYKTIASPTPLGSLVNPSSGATIPAGTLPVGTPLASMYSIRQQRDREIDDSSLYNQTNVTWIIPGAVTHTIIGGVDVGSDRYRNGTFTRVNSVGVVGNAVNISPIPPVNLGNPVYGPKPALTATVLRVMTADTNSQAHSAALYINDQVDLGEHWKLVAGLRWDRFEITQSQYSFNYFPIPTGPVAAPTISYSNLNHTDSMLSRRAGIIWQPDSKSSYYFSYGTSFNPSGESVVLSTNNANLAPEKNRSFEMGAKWSLLDNDLLLNAAVFRVEKTNARTTDLSAGTTQVLEGLTRVDGIELSATGSITANWQVIAGYGLLDGEIVESNDSITFNFTGTVVPVFARGKTLQNTPRHNANLWTTYRLAGTFEVGGGANYSSDRFVNNFETAVIDGYVRADLTFAYLQSRYDIRVNVLNATDKMYFETASAGRATPATGRTFVVRAAYRF